MRAAALVGLENVALWHERDISHSSAERVVLPDAFLALDYMLDRFAWLVDGLVVDPERMRRNLDASHGLVFSQRVLLALVEAGLARDEAYRLVQRNALRAWDEERDFRELVAADPEIAAPPRRVALGGGLRPRRRARARRRPLRAPRGARDPKGGSRSCLSAVHVASGKVREIYELDDERLLLVASDRISTFDVVLPTEIPDKGRVLTGLSGFWFARTREIVPNHLLALRRGRPLDRVPRLAMLPIECVVRGYLAGSGWKDYLATGAVCGHRLPAGLRESDQLPEPIFTPATKAQTGHDENIDRDAGRRARRRRSSSTRSSGSSLELYRFGAEHARRARDHHRRHEVRVRARRRRDARPRRRGADAGLVALLAGGRVRAGPARSRRSTSSSCATTARRSAGTRRYPGPELPDEVVAGTRARYVEAFERLTGIAFDDYLADPRWCSR